MRYRVIATTTEFGTTYFYVETERWSWWRRRHVWREFCEPHTRANTAGEAVSRFDRLRQPDRIVEEGER